MAQPYTPPSVVRSHYTAGVRRLLHARGERSQRPAPCAVGVSVCGWTPTLGTETSKSKIKPKTLGKTGFPTPYTLLRGCLRRVPWKLGYGDWGLTLGFEIQVSSFGVWGLGSRVEVLGFG